MSFVSRQTRIKRLLNSKSARDGYVFENIKRMVPFQIRTMREERGWSQGRAGEALGKPQNVVSRLESPAYGKLTLQTLLDVAQGFDVGLLIKFVPFSRLVREYDDLSALALSAKSVSDKAEQRRLTAWASADPLESRLRLVDSPGEGATSQLALPGVYERGQTDNVSVFRVRRRQRRIKMRKRHVTTQPLNEPASMSRPTGAIAA